MLFYQMENRNGKTKTTFLYDCIKADILSQKLSAGEKLPSKRELSGHLGVSVLTVENAYSLLEEEGYISPKPRAGFFVNDLPLPAAAPSDTKEIRFLEEESAASPAAGVPSVSMQTIARIIRKLLSEQPERILADSPSCGCAVLRNAIAGYLRRFRGMEVMPANIVVGSGAEYLYGLVAQLFGKGAAIGIEYPSYEKIEKTYQLHGANVEHLAMGKDGLEASALKDTSAALLHVTPFHSYPTGVTASAQKRYAYLQWAEKNDAYILEDDYDSEFAFLKKPIEPLFSMDTAGRVIYMNTFSKSIARGIRIAYMILPDALFSRFEETLGFYSCTVPALDQYVLAEFLNSGSFERHLSRIRKTL